MDRSGDGSIEVKELQDGFKSVFENNVIDKIIEGYYKDGLNNPDGNMEQTDFEYLEGYIGELEALRQRANPGENYFKYDQNDLETILDYADIDGNHRIDKEDFLMASVDLSEKSFSKYCEIAYLKMFNNDMQQIDKQTFIEVICK